MMQRFFHQFKSLFQKPELYWWTPGERHPFGIHQNFGDALNPWVIERLIGRTPRTARSSDTGKMLAIGSILSHAKAGDVVWGSGLNGKVLDAKGQILLPKQPEKIRFHAIRGPLTAKLIARAGGSVPEVFGDPGILVRKWVKPSEKRNGIVLLPHFSDLEYCLHSGMTEEMTILRVDQPIEQLIQAINGAERLLTSSLHGIIVAEALQVPVTFFRMSQEEVLFKYEDYFASTQRDLPEKIPHDLRAALDADHLPAAKALDSMCDSLLKAFPAKHFGLTGMLGQATDHAPVP